MNRTNINTISLDSQFRGGDILFWLLDIAVQDSTEWASWKSDIRILRDRVISHVRLVHDQNDSEIENLFDILWNVRTWEQFLEVGGDVLQLVKSVCDRLAWLEIPDSTKWITSGLIRSTMARFHALLEERWKAISPETWQITQWTESSTNLVHEVAPPVTEEMPEPAVTVVPPEPERVVVTPMPQASWTPVVPEISLKEATYGSDMIGKMALFFEHASKSRDLCLVFADFYQERIQHVKTLYITTFIEYAKLRFLDIKPADAWSILMQLATQMKKQEKNPARYPFELRRGWWIDLRGISQEEDKWVEQVTSPSVPATPHLELHKDSPSAPSVSQPTKAVPQPSKPSVSAISPGESIWAKAVERAAATSATPWVQKSPKSTAPIPRKSPDEAVVLFSPTSLDDDDDEELDDEEVPELGTSETHGLNGGGKNGRSSKRLSEYWNGWVSWSWFELDGWIKIYLREIRKTPLLTREQEVELAERIKAGDLEARAHMIKANLRLVVKIAQGYANYWLPLLDLISEGNIGLMKAVERFDPNKGGKLSTYASWWIKQTIKRALANQSKTIRLPVHMVDKIAKLRRLEMALTEELGRQPTEEEIAEEIGIDRVKLAHIRQASMRPMSLDAPISDDDTTEFGEIIGDDRAQNPLELVIHKALHSSNSIDALLSVLDERKRRIIEGRYGLNGEKPKTLEEMGQEFGCTRERIRQLQNIALKKLRRALQKRENPGPKPAKGLVPTPEEKEKRKKRFQSVQLPEGPVSEEEELES
jgi:RNA polymerase primary sigma factor